MVCFSGSFANDMWEENLVAPGSSEVRVLREELAERRECKNDSICSVRFRDVDVGHS